MRAHHNTLPKDQRIEGIVAEQRNKTIHRMVRTGACKLTKIDCVYCCDRAFRLGYFVCVLCLCENAYAHSVYVFQFAIVKILRPKLRYNTHTQTPKSKCAHFHHAVR